MVPEKCNVSVGDINQVSIPVTTGEDCHPVLFINRSPKDEFIVLVAP